MLDTAEHRAREESESERERERDYRALWTGTRSDIDGDEGLFLPKGKLCGVPEWLLVPLKASCSAERGH